MMFKWPWARAKHHADAIPGYRVVLLTIYLVLGWAGVGFIDNSSPTLEQSLSTPVYDAWTFLFLAGGLVGGVGVMQKWHYVEGIGLIGLFGAIMTYVAALLFSDPLLVNTGVNYGLALVIAALGLCMVLRGLAVKHQIGLRNKWSKEYRAR